MSREDTRRENRSEMNASMNRRSDTLHAEDPRELAVRERLNMFHQDAFYIDSRTIPMGKQYAYVRISLCGQDDLDSLPDAMNRGFNLVPASRHPEKKLPNIFSRRNEMSDYIVVKGLILCERDIKYKELEQKKFMELNYQVVNSLEGLERLQADPYNPAFSVNKVSMPGSPMGFQAG